MIDNVATQRYERRIRKILEDLAHQFSINEREEVVYLIENRELFEAVRTLAWIVADEKKEITRAIYDEIISLAEDAVAPGDMPASLENCVGPL